jgi:hypothetical protein
MGVFHTRASKKRDRAQAELLKQQTRQLRRDGRTAKHAQQAGSIEERAEEHAGNPLRRPTVGRAISTWAANRRAAKEGSEESGGQMMP